METKSAVLERIKAIARRYDPQAEVVLFGSRARGEARTDSDWDVLILLDVPVDEALKTRFRRQVLDLELEFDCVIFTLIENRLAGAVRFGLVPDYRAGGRCRMTFDKIDLIPYC